MLSVLSTLFLKLQTERKVLRGMKEKKVEGKLVRVGMPQVHGVVHRMDKEARKRNVRIVGTHRNKLGGLPNKTRELAEKGRKVDKCTEHKESAFPCSNRGSIYEIKMSCGGVYIGETGRCPNKRLEEHLGGKAKYSTFVEHKNKCGCEVDKEESSVLVQRSKWPYVRRLQEALAMEERAETLGQDKVISNPSATPTAWERRFLNEKSQ